MSDEDRMRRRAEAADSLNRHESRGDGEKIVAGLSDGLRVLRDLFLARVHSDVQQLFGTDSMMINTAALKSETQARAEVDLFQVLVVTSEVAAHRYVRADEDWVMSWLGKLRLGETINNPTVQQRLATYRSLDPEGRRRVFASLLERTLPAARRAPLVVYPLFPIAAQLVTSLVFNDVAAAEEDRRRQMGMLPNIVDCHQCHGRILEVGDICQECGNPFWKIQWMTAD